MAPAPSKFSSPDTGSVFLSLPLDLSYEILLRLPAKNLCRLRAVSRAWRSLLSDPQFITAHGARHPGPLIVAGNPAPARRRNDDRLYIMDLRGRIVKRIYVTAGGTWNNATESISSQDGLVCILSDMGKRCRVLNPATGAVSALPEGLAEDHAAHEVDIEQYSASVVCGKVATTGEYKVLRVLGERIFFSYRQNLKPLCEVLTLDGSGVGCAPWRGKKASPYPVSVDGVTNRAVVNGTVYFFVNELAPRHIAGPKRIASFDLGMEEWRRTLIKGPEINWSSVGNNNGEYKHHFSLAAVNDCLAVAHCVRDTFMDLWLLKDIEQGLWVKQHSIQMKGTYWYINHRMRPLFVVSDGSVVVYGETKGLLRIYDPKTRTSHLNVAQITGHVGFDLYTGNLLSLPNGGGSQ